MLTSEQVSVIRFSTWLRKRPKVIKDMVKKYPYLKPWYELEMIETGQICQVTSYNEGGTVTVNAYYKDVPFITSVFGVLPTDLRTMEKK